ncbi:MAG TPA: N-acetylmuramoyl-L-alanine amidase [bacterium]|nr:N-acetylmuramoyl-L-alanine amidase [bacterium]
MVAAAVWTGPAPLFAAKLNIVNHYSPENKNREKRPSTDYIILHTTEGATAGSLKKVTRNGETHYFVDPAGKVYRIIQRDRIALHAGRSMWNGRANLDDVSLGIEVVGYHNRDLTAAQYVALKELLRQLRNIYRIPDERVLTHSMVAYGLPNRWHATSHRGRKRCGMLFARKDVRVKLGIERAPDCDPDVRAGRLTVGDPYLARVLYGSPRTQEEALSRFVGADAQTIAKGRSAWDVARDQYNSPQTVYIFPDGKVLRGNEIVAWGSIPAGTRVILSDNQRDNPPETIRILGRDGSTAAEIAGGEYASASTLYLYPDGRYRLGNDLTAGDFKTLPVNTRILLGYSVAGKVTPETSAFDICGPDWNLPATIYFLPDGRLLPGNEIGEKSIPRETTVFTRR